MIRLKVISLGVLLVGLGLFQALASADAIDSHNTYQYREGDQGDWYEWWYYKITDPKSGEAFFFDYGVVNPWDTSAQKKASHSFVSAGDFKKSVRIEEQFEVKKFEASRSAVQVRLGENRATDQLISGAVKDQAGHSLVWELKFEKQWAFNAMGWGLNLPNVTNIYWYPAQSSALASGWVIRDGEKIVFEKVPAYQDRNWGRSFPKWWSWIVANYFENSPGTALVSGGGRPKLFGGIELGEGMNVGFLYEGKEYSFRANDLDKINAEIRFGKWEIQARNKRGDQISISANAPREKFLLLPFQTPQGPQYYDYEALLGDVKVKFQKMSLTPVPHLEQTVELISHQAGIEYGSFDPQKFESIWDSSFNFW